MTRFEPTPDTDAQAAVTLLSVSAALALALTGAIYLLSLAAHWLHRAL